MQPIAAGDGKRAAAKIQSICNGKCGPITMQRLARAAEKPPAQEQWQAMEKQRAEQWKQSKIRTRGDIRLYHPGNGAVRGLPSGGRGLLAGFVDEPGRN